MWNKAHQGFSPQSAFDELKMSQRVTRTDLPRAAPTISPPFPLRLTFRSQVAMTFLLITNRIIRWVSSNPLHFMTTSCWIFFILTENIKNYLIFFSKRLFLKYFKLWATRTTFFHNNFLWAVVFKIVVVKDDRLESCVFYLNTVFF